MTNYSVMIEEWCLLGHQRDQPLVLCNIFINNLKYRISNILTKLLGDTKCTGDVKKRNEDVEDLIITAWIESKEKNFPIISTHSTTAGYNKYSKEKICGIEDLLRNHPEGRSRSSGWQSKISISSIYITQQQMRIKCSVGQRLRKIIS